MKKQYKIFILILTAVLLFAVIAIHVNNPIKGVYNRLVNTPDLIKKNTFVCLNDVDDKNKAIKDFYDIYLQKRGYAGLQDERSSIEGDPIDIYLATNDGNFSLVIDYTRDSWSNRNFIIEEPKDVLVGIYSKDKGFLPLTDGNDNITLKIIRVSGEEIHF